MKLIVGLGNPEKRYEHTRHNIGFRVLDAMISDWQEHKKLQSAISKRGDVVYVKPLTFMNNSGEAVRAAMHCYKIAVPELLVIFDDKDLPFGTIRFRTKGSSGGHHGVQSIIDQIDSNQFARFKIGTAPKDSAVVIRDTVDYVLGKFSKEEEKELPEMIERVVRKVKEWCL